MKKGSHVLPSPARRGFLKVAGLAPAVAGMLSGPDVAAAADDYPNLAELRAAREKQGIIPPHKTYRPTAHQLNCTSDVP